MNYLKMSNKRKNKKKTFSIVIWIIIIVTLLVFFSKVDIPGISNISGKITGRSW